MDKPITMTEEHGSVLGARQPTEEWTRTPEIAAVIRTLSRADMVAFHNEYVVPSAEQRQLRVLVAGSKELAANPDWAEGTSAAAVEEHGELRHVPARVDRK